jgi:hypothetical protein
VTTEPRPVTPASIAWMAGVLDAHGSVYIKSNSSRADGSEQVVLHLSSSKSEMIVKMSQMTGTKEDRSVIKAKTLNWTARGCVSHCPEAHIHYHTEMPEATRWAVTGSALAIVLWNTRRHMVSTAQDWDAALSVCLEQARLTGQGAHAVKRSTQRMAALGWPIPPLLKILLDPEHSLRVPDS